MNIFIIRLKFIVTKSEFRKNDYSYNSIFGLTLVSNVFEKRAKKNNQSYLNRRD